MRTKITLLTLLSLTNLVACASPIPLPHDWDRDDAKTLAAAKERGARSAMHDIKRGVLRILTWGGPIAPGFGLPANDPETGYRYEWIAGDAVTERFRVEVRAYNDAMLAWHAKHRT